MSIEQIRIPDIGDVSEVEVIELCVAEGDEIAVDDALLVIESDKASMEVPSNRAGKLRRLTVAVGDTCAEGDVIAEIEVESDGDADANVDVDDDGDSKSSAQAESSAEDADEVDSDPASDDDSDDDDADDDDAEREDGASESLSNADSATETIEVRVPDVGDATEVVVVEVMVTAGDDVAAEDGLIALESDKATMEIPAPKPGTVVSVEVKEGDSVSEGTLVARLQVAAANAPRKPEGGKARRADAEGREDVVGLGRPDRGGDAQAGRDRRRAGRMRAAAAAIGCRC